ncbi:hypothetical protein AKJ09_04758 [Labilithrix luteola]|uniref:Uncharacterized protein n=1 Tax=Labilithrix luteola TaxID=1391654 RepID=A0A0K1PY74_9BACT|nr:hypothetical protein AKJ09_04758 [Labilithrix luteola]
MALALEEGLESELAVRLARERVIHSTTGRLEELADRRSTSASTWGLRAPVSTSGVLRVL